MVSEAKTTARPAGWGTSPRWLKLLLLFSLSFNLVIAGALAGALWGKKTRYYSNSRSGSEISFYSFARTLPKERARVLRRAARGAKRDLRPYLVDIAAARRAAAEQLADDPFDSETLKGAFGRVSEAQKRLKAAATKTIVETAAALTPEERRELRAWWMARKPYLFRDPPSPKPKKKRQSTKRKTSKDASPGGASQK